MRYRIYRFNFDILKDWFSTGIHLRNSYEILEGGLPPDAKIVSVMSYGNLLQIPEEVATGIELLVQSESFDPVDRPENIPKFPITVRSL
ncbi:MAG TPA: hypothetical protein VHA06_17860 [Candidatus Angelobacter sp.]|jgi:hypothetical protein|nr:hypothetical protein [Candidatus Angelobacter sp.]